MKENNGPKMLRIFCVRQGSKFCS